MLEIIQDSSFKKIKMIEHGFFTRYGGVSAGWYESLNCAYASQDNPDSVRENRRRAMAYFDRPLESLVTVKMVHGNHVVVVDEPWLEQNKPQADAMVTSLPQIVLGLDSADCPIVLFADDQAGVIGVAHAGWKGAKSGVVEETIKKMIFLGAKPHQIAATISPCIGQDSYEVGLEFYQQFLYDNLENKNHFKFSNKPNHFFFDLPGYIENRLLKLKLKSISSEAAIDTYSDKRFFSYRRATHKGEASFGGHLSCIYIKEDHSQL